MLVLVRQRGESVFIDGRKIQVVVMDIRGDKVRLGFQADADVSIHRGEVLDAIEAERGEHEARQRQGRKP